MFPKYATFKQKELKLILLADKAKAHLSLNVLSIKN